MGKIRWLGHAGFEIELTNKVVLIDPWLDGNPKAPMRAADVKPTLFASLTIIRTTSATLFKPANELELPLSACMN